RELLRAEPIAANLAVGLGVGDRDQVAAILEARVKDDVLGTAAAKHARGHADRSEQGSAGNPERDGLGGDGALLLLGDFFDFGEVEQGHALASAGRLLARQIHRVGGHRDLRAIAEIAPAKGYIAHDTLPQPDGKGDEYPRCGLNGALTAAAACPSVA